MTVRFDNLNRTLSRRFGGVVKVVGNSGSHDCSRVAVLQLIARYLFPTPSSD